MIRQHFHHGVVRQRQITNEVPDAIVPAVLPDLLGKSALEVVLSTTVIRGKMGNAQWREHDPQDSKLFSWGRPESKAIPLNGVFHFLTQPNGGLLGRGVARGWRSRGFGATPPPQV